MIHNCQKMFQYKKISITQQHLTEVSFWLSLLMKLQIAFSTDEFKRRCHNREEQKKNKSKTPIMINYRKKPNNHKINMHHHLMKKQNQTKYFRCQLLTQSTSISHIITKYSHRELTTTSPGLLKLKISRQRRL